MSQPATLQAERFDIGEGRAYWGQRCSHTVNGQTPAHHESIYRFYDDAGHLLYVGITFSILSRWTKHRRKPWWPQVRSATVICFPSEGIARAAEIEAILTENPLHNIARPAVRA